MMGETKERGAAWMGMNRSVARNRRARTEPWKSTKEKKLMLYTIIGILLLLWVLGFAMNVGGNVIHALLVIALVVFLVNLISGRRAV
jgi:Family of unknown function (DUF5670)